MRVVISGWFSGRSVGSGRYTDQLVAALRRGTEAGASGTAPGPPSSHSFELVVPEGERNHLRKLEFEQITLPRAAAAADVCHVPYWGPPLRVARPLVVTVHDLIPLLLPEYRANWRLRAYISLARRATRRAAAVITDSEYTAQDIATNLEVSRERVHVIPLGVEARFLTPFRPRQTRQSVGRPLRVGDLELPGRYGLYLGGFDPRKNLVTLFAAWREVFNRTGVPLVVAGDLKHSGKTFAAHPTETARQVGLAPEGVLFVGHVPTEDLPALYRGAAVFAYPSRYEGFGLPPLEAMACTTPVVAADATSLPEVVGEAGLLLPPQDEAAWAEALTNVLEDTTLAERLRRAGPERAARFTWERTAEATLRVYEHVRE